MAKSEYKQYLEYFEKNGKTTVKNDSGETGVKLVHPNYRKILAFAKEADENDSAALNLLVKACAYIDRVSGKKKEFKPIAESKEKTPETPETDSDKTPENSETDSDKTDDKKTNSDKNPDSKKGQKGKNTQKEK
jgi:hypothetical protein